MIDWARFYANGGYSNENSDPESYDDGRDEDEETDETEEKETITGKIGETFTTDKGTFQIVETSNDTCDGCYFEGRLCSEKHWNTFFDCSETWRDDKKNVIIKRIK